MKINKWNIDFGNRRKCIENQFTGPKDPEKLSTIQMIGSSKTSVA